MGVVNVPISKIILGNQLNNSEIESTADRVTLSANPPSIGSKIRFDFSYDGSPRKKITITDLYLSFTARYAANGSPYTAGYYLPMQIQIPGYNNCGQYATDKWMRFTQASSTADYVSFYGISGINPPYVAVNVADIVPEARNLYPADYASSKAPTKFTWEFYAETPTDGTPLTQKNAEIQWKSLPSGTINTVDISGTIAEYTFPANTLPNSGSFQWRIRVQSNDDVYSLWTDWKTVSTNEPVGTVGNIHPNGVTIDGEITNRVSWDYISDYGVLPNGYDIQQSIDGVTWQTIATATDTYVCYADIPANTFQGGNVKCRIRAYNSSGTAGNWTMFALIVRSHPQKPSIYQIIDTDTDKPTVYWTSDSQAAFEIIIVSANGEQVYRLEKISSSKNHKIEKRIDDGDYEIRISVINNYNLRSEYGIRQFTISTEKPQKPTISLTQKSDSVHLDFAYGTEKAVLMRNSTVIANVSGLNEYTDYSAFGECEYVIRALSESSFCDSDAVYQTVKMKYATMSPADNYVDRLKFLVKAGSQPDRTVDISKTATLIQFAGREYPVVEFGNNSEMIKRFTYSIFSESDLQRLINLVGTIVFWRDKHDSFYAVLSGLTHVRSRRYIDVSFNLTKIDYTVGFDYD